jgi:hypothetical protein
VNDETTARSKPRRLPTQKRGQAVQPPGGPSQIWNARGVLTTLRNGTRWRAGNSPLPLIVRHDPLVVRIQTESTAAQRAVQYLKRISALTGAKQVNGDSYRLTVGRKHFLVDSKYVRVIKRDGKSTCFSVLAVPDMPGAEVVASALLQLKNNPKLFKKWKKQPGYAFKADGQMLRYTYRSGWDET